MGWYAGVATGLGVFIVVAALRCILQGPSGFGALVLVPVVAVAVAAWPWALLLDEAAGGPKVNHAAAYALMAVGMLLEGVGAYVAARTCLRRRRPPAGSGGSPA